MPHKGWARHQAQLWTDAGWGPLEVTQGATPGGLSKPGPQFPGVGLVGSQLSPAPVNSSSCQAEASGHCPSPRTGLPPGRAGGHERVQIALHRGLSPAAISHLGAGSSVPVPGPLQQPQLRTPATPALSFALCGRQLATQGSKSTERGSPLTSSGQVQGHHHIEDPAGGHEDPEEQADQHEQAGLA